MEFYRFSSDLQSISSFHLLLDLFQHVNCLHAYLHTYKCICNSESIISLIMS